MCLATQQSRDILIYDLRIIYTRYRLCFPIARQRPFIKCSHLLKKRDRFGQEITLNPYHSSTIVALASSRTTPHRKVYVQWSWLYRNSDERHYHPHLFPWTLHLQWTSLPSSAIATGFPTLLHHPPLRLDHTCLYHQHLRRHHRHL